MRWNKKQKPTWGTFRERKKFLWFPKTINGETRWLEVSRWQEEFRIITGYAPYIYRWVPIHWIPNGIINSFIEKEELKRPIPPAGMTGI